ncbi:MAG: serine/threonine-protein kinase [Cyanobacteria bacterium P01_A01_bin.37]
MSLCINPHCAQPNHVGNDASRFCQSCGAGLVLQERYRVMRLLTDKSGFGVVYEAYERNSPKILKVLKSRHNDNPKAVELFEQEALVLSRLHHPGIPRVDDDACFQFRPSPEGELLHCIVMEKIDGPNLSEWMRQQGGNPISEKQAVSWLRQISDVLHLVHQENFFHRDIKPENIMLRSTGQLVLVDFGAAREMTYTYFEQLGATAGITKVSSAGYTPPEQERGQAVPQSDFYALGCTFIFLLTGRQPTEPAIYDSLENEFQWRQFAPQVSSELADLIDCMTAVRASARPKSTEELIDRIVAIAQSVQTRSITMPPPRDPQTSSSKHQRHAYHPGSNHGHHPPSEPNSQHHHVYPGGEDRQILERENSVPNATSQQPSIYQGSSHSANPNSPNGFPNYPIQGALNADYPVTDLGYVNPHEMPSHYPAMSQIPTSPHGVHPPSAVPEAPSSRRPQRWIWFVGAALAAVVIGGAGTWAIIRMRSSGESEVPLAEEPYVIAETLSHHDEDVKELVLSSDQQLLASGSDDTQVILWDMVNRQMKFLLTGHKNSVNALAFTPNDQYIASAGGDLYIKIWNTETGTEVKTLTGHTQSVNDLIFTSDGERLISASADATIRVWNWRSGEEVMTLSGHEGFVNTIALSPDERALVSGATDNTIRIWDVATGEETGQLLGHTSFVNAVAISPDGQWVSSASADATIKLWNPNTGREIRTLDAHDSYVNALLFSPDGRFILSSSADQTIKLWQVRAGVLELSIPWAGTFIDAIAVKFEGPTWQVIAGGKGSHDIQIWQLRR